MLRKRSVVFNQSISEEYNYFVRPCRQNIYYPNGFAVKQIKGLYHHAEKLLFTDDYFNHLKVFVFLGRVSKSNFTM